MHMYKAKIKAADLQFNRAVLDFLARNKTLKLAQASIAKVLENNSNPSRSGVRSQAIQAVLDKA